MNMGQFVKISDTSKKGLEVNLFNSVTVLQKDATCSPQEQSLTLHAATPIIHLY